MNYKEWEQAVPDSLKADSLWKMRVYRLALFIADVGWADISKLMQDRRTVGLADQLYRALGSVGANIAEGYSRGTGKDRARFYEYALGSARESRIWYFQARHVLGDTVALHRLDMLSEMVRLLLSMIPHQRGQSLREDGSIYETTSFVAESGGSNDDILSHLLQNVPLSVWQDD